MNPSNKLCFSEQFQHDWVTGKYISLGNYSIGDVVTIAETSNVGYEYQCFAVKAGDTVYIDAQGGNSPRAYALLDSNNRLLEMAEANATIDKTLTIANDGKIIVNDELGTIASPVVTHKGVREPSAIYLNGYAKRVHLGADKVWIRKDEPMYIGANQEMTWSAVGSYITNNGNIGSVVDFTPVSATNWQYTIVSVKKGDVLLLTCQGYIGAGTWCFTDNSRKILSKSEQALLCNATPLTATADGYLVCNNLTTSVASPICKRVNPHKYDTVKIGNQVWMASNLDENLGLLQSNQWYYNNDKATYGKYGKLYTWTNLNTNLSAILPSGWRWATKADFTTLATTCGGTSVAGKVLKNDSWGWTGGFGTDEQNFGLVGSGYWNQTAFVSININSRHWCAEEEYFALGDKDEDSFTLGRGVSLDTGRSVRLVKNNAV